MSRRISKPRRWILIASAACALLAHLDAKALSDEQMAVGSRFLAAREFAKAEAFYRKALERDPGDLVARNQLALSLMNQGKHQAAAEQLDKVISVEPENLGAQWYAALNMQMSGDYRKAVAAFEQLVPRLEGRPQYIDAQYLIARSLSALLSPDVSKVKPQDLFGSNVGLSQVEVDRLIAAFEAYLSLRPDATDRNEIEGYLRALRENRPPKNVERWVWTNPP